MFLFNRKKREKKPMPHWVMWLAVAFILYAVFTKDERVNTSPVENTAMPNGQDVTNSANNTSESAVENKDEPFIDPKKIFNTKALEGRLWPQKNIKLDIKDNKAGEGEIVVCGQKVTIKYNSFTEDGKPIEKDQKISFQIGEAMVMPALEKGVLGMKKNGNRTIIVPANMAYGIEKYKRDDVPALANIKFEAEMLDVTPPLPDTSAYRVIGDTKAQGAPQNCGELVKLHIAVWNVEGKKIFDSRDKNGEPVKFTPGKSEMILGIELGVLQMSPEMHRNLIIPPVLQKTLNGNPSVIDFNLPPNQTVLVDIESVE